MLFALLALGAMTFVAYVLLPDGRREWCLAIPIVGIGLALVFAALFVLWAATYISWEVHPLLGVSVGGLVLLFEVRLGKLMLRELL